MRFLLLLSALLLAPIALAQDTLTANGSSAAAPLVDEPFPALELPDAFGVSYQVPYPSVRHVLFSGDMDANDLMRDGFSELDKGDFTAAGLVYVADISGMPSLVGRLFAIPAMKDYPFRVLLARQAETVAMLPRQTGAVSVISLSPEGEVERLRFVRSEEGLRALLAR